MSLKTIKLKIQSVKKTAKVTRAMEAVSAVKMRKAQLRAIGARGYARAAMRILMHLGGNLAGTHHPLTVAHAHAKKIAVIIVTSDKGLAGALNASVLKAVQRVCTLENVQLKDVLALCLGRRGYEFSLRRGFDIRYSETNITDAVELDKLESVSGHAIQMYTEAEVRAVYVIYTNFKSTFEQSAEIRQLLPLSLPTLLQIVEGILPEKGALARESKHEVLQDAMKSDYVIEPDPESVMRTVIPNLVNIGLFHALLESKASEHSARMVAMKSATDKAKEVAHELTLEFNKERQADITSEISEITGGIEAMK